MPTRPNIVLFFADDQRFATLGALGHPCLKTPNLDELFQRGTYFDCAHIMGGSSGAVCMPSRAMLHTGRTLYHIQDEGQSIPADHALLAQHFRKAGYETFGTGKWHNGYESYHRSFSDGGEIFFGGMNDHWRVPACEFRPDGDYPDPKDLHVRFGKLESDKRFAYDHIASGTHSSDLFAEASRDFLQRRKRDKPFFLYLSFMAPHDPRETWGQYHKMYPPEKVDLPPNFRPSHPFDNGAMEIRDEKLASRPREEEEVRGHIADYYAMISHLDAAVGKVLDELKDSGDFENTIFVFAGDNGLAVGRHGLMGKQNLYDHSVRVPLLMAGAGIQPGQRRDDLCYLIDIFPTLCDLAGLDTPASVEGSSLAEATRGQAGPGRDHVLLAYTHLQRGVRERRWKLIEYAVGDQRHTQLFDLEKDPWEIEDLSRDAACQEHVSRLRGKLTAWRDELDDDRPGQGREFWQKCRI